MANVSLNFANFELAWEGINEFIMNNTDEIVSKGLGGCYGTEACLYNTVITVDCAMVNPEFDFGKALGYTYKKWSKLITNYVNMYYLDLVKAEVQSRIKKNARSYNVIVHFDNAHGGGKDCLIGLQFQKRDQSPYPYVIFTSRASECTKRLLFDLLLVQRMAEYVYGVDQPIHAVLLIPYMYIHIESALMYIFHKGGPENTLIPNPDGSLDDYQTKIKDKYQEFSTKVPTTIKYKVHKRVADLIQGTGTKKPPVLARDLNLDLINPNIVNPKTLKLLNSGLEGIL